MTTRYIEGPTDYVRVKISCVRESKKEVKRGYYYVIQYFSISYVGLLFFYIFALRNSHIIV
jgi:hypothetical protein